MVCWEAAKTDGECPDPNHVGYDVKVLMPPEDLDLLWEDRAAWYYDDHSVRARGLWAPGPEEPR